MKKIQQSVGIQWGIEPSWVVSLPICDFLLQSLLISLCLGLHIKLRLLIVLTTKRLQRAKNRKPHEGKYKQIVIKREMWFAFGQHHSPRSQEVINPCQM